jgi:hypothetical protein
MKRNLGRKTRKEKMTLYKAMAVSVLLFGSEARTVEREDTARNQEAE